MKLDLYNGFISYDILEMIMVICGDRKNFIG